MIRQMVEALVDLIWPPEPGDLPVPFWRKAVILLAAVVLLLILALLA